MAASEAVIIGGLQIPAETALGRGPEHEIQRGFGGDGIRGRAIRANVDPFGAEAEHEFDFFRQGPGFLEKKIGVPFGGVADEERRYAGFDLQPVLEGCDFGGEVRTEARSAAREIPTCGAAEFEDGGGLGFLIGRLRRRGLSEGASVAEQHSQKAERLHAVAVVR